MVSPSLKTLRPAFDCRSTDHHRIEGRCLVDDRPVGLLSDALGPELSRVP